MGIIKALTSAIGSSLADQWLEVIEADNMSDSTVFTCGVQVRKNDRRNQNEKGTMDTVSNGSVIHVQPNQFMMLVDGGKVVDYTAEEGYYTVNNSSLPSLFNGQFGDTLKESFNRIRYGGTTPTSQQVFYINLQEIKGIKFGTRNPINYFDCFYNAELFLRAHGTYSIKITDPLKFFSEAIPRNRSRVDIGDINEQYLTEFLDALQSAMNQMSADGERISFVTSKSRELSKYLSGILDEDWDKLRGMQIQSVGIASISYDDASTKLINMRNQGAMLVDPNIREGYIQGSVARGIEAAGSNAGGAMNGFLGMGIGMQNTGVSVGAMSQANQQQIQWQNEEARRLEEQEKLSTQATKENVWTCSCGTVNSGKFCIECGKPRGDSWICSCGTENSGKFCSECGKSRPVHVPAAAPSKYRCSNCGFVPEDPTAPPKFCPECGDPFNANDIDQ